MKLKINKHYLVVTAKVKVMLFALAPQRTSGFFNKMRKASAVTFMEA